MSILGACPKCGLDFVIDVPSESDTDNMTCACDHCGTEKKVKVFRKHHTKLMAAAIRKRERDDNEAAANDRRIEEDRQKQAEAIRRREQDAAILHNAPTTETICTSDTPLTSPVDHARSETIPTHKAIKRTHALFIWFSVCGLVNLLVLFLVSMQWWYFALPIWLLLAWYCWFNWENISYSNRKRIAEGHIFSRRQWIALFAIIIAPLWLQRDPPVYATLIAADPTVFADGAQCIMAYEQNLKYVVSMQQFGRLRFATLPIGARVELAYFISFADEWVQVYYKRDGSTTRHEGIVDPAGWWYVKAVNLEIEIPSDDTP